MKNFGLIFQYEIKKITHRKLWLIAFAAILLFTILLNLYTIFDFSVGWSGAQVLKANKNNDGLVIDKSAFFNGIPIYYVNYFLISTRIRHFQWILQFRMIGPVFFFFFCQLLPIVRGISLQFKIITGCTGQLITWD